MVWVDPEFDVPTIPENEKYEGAEVDANVLKGNHCAPCVEAAWRRIVLTDNKHFRKVLQ